MNLGALRAEVQAHGVDTGAVFTNARINQFINDGYMHVVRRVQYWADEATDDFSTVAGTASYPQPADFGKDRALHFTGTSFTGELRSVGLRTIDRSTPTSGVPRYYALDGANIRLYPTPDNVYTLELRYFKIPTLLSADGDTPNLPTDYHRLLWIWAVKECLEGEDDVQDAPYWQQKFDTLLSEFTADVRFPNDDAPSQIASMWEGPPVLGSNVWQRNI